MLFLRKEAAELRLLVTGGGTGGHVYPALAVIDYLKRRHPRLECTWVGSDRMESQVVPNRGLAFHRIDIRFSYRPFNSGNFRYYLMHILPILYGRPFRQASHAVESLRPHFVLATGGYVSAPCLLAAQRAGIPYALLQIDSRPGLVNWFFADKAWRVYASSSRAGQGLEGRCSGSKILVSGYPSTLPSQTASSVYSSLGIDRRRKLMLAMGGSLGAAAIDRIVSEILAASAGMQDERLKDLAIVHVIGKRPGVPEVPQDSGRSGAVVYKAIDFLDDVPSVLAAAGFYLGRSGAATVGEIIASGVPSILVPDPQHSDKQQLANAEELVSAGLGTIMDQDDTRGADVLAWVLDHWDHEKSPPGGELPAEIIGEDILRAMDPS